MSLHPGEHRALVRLANLHRREAPTIPSGDGPVRTPRRVVVFGTGPDWVQVTWSRMGPGPVEVRCGDHRLELITDGGPGAAVVRGLAPDTHHHVELIGPGTGGRRLGLRAHTLVRPPGEELLRLATVGDAHIGGNSTGYFHTIVELPTPAVPNPVRCLRAALAEAAHWGAEQVVVKGDLVDRSDREHWAVAADVLSGCRPPIALVAGNHERSQKGEVDAHAGAAEVGLTLADGVSVLDRNGVRIVLGDTTRDASDLGRIDHVHERIVEAASVDAPVLVALHHQLMRRRLPTYLPPGVPGPSARRFLRELGRANRRTIVTSGHTHRHRRRRHGPVTITEVGSTKDFPGTWAGYQFFEGGVVQTVRRIGEPSVIRWTDHTRRAAAGAWSAWAPGALADRCFSITW